jgi:hypothetical protein
MDSSKARPELRERTSSAASKATMSHESLHELAQEELERTSSVAVSPELQPQTDSLTNNFQPEADLDKLPGVGQPRAETESSKFGGEEEDPNVGMSFQRPTSPATVHKVKDVSYQKVGENGISRMHKFSLYETSARFYLIGTDIAEQQFRVLKIDRTSPPGLLNIVDDDIVYERKEIFRLLGTIQDGNKGTDGIYTFHRRILHAAYLKKNTSSHAGRALHLSS